MYVLSNLKENIVRKPACLTVLHNVLKGVSALGKTRALYWANNSLLLLMMMTMMIHHFGCYRKQASSKPHSLYEIRLGIRGRGGIEYRLVARYDDGEEQNVAALCKVRAWRNIHEHATVIRNGDTGTGFTDERLIV
ncbi:jg1788 [Pararge aegeria aegeria]|uniref:Jg1788 protein n=1 Tax=Pararge aegeria aegeria TaxID=348720 RepID=A0A8S4RPI0_9NEOP|nr:jg1788 [Pararge aegeria aegeria]